MSSSTTRARITNTGNSHMPDTDQAADKPAELTLKRPAHRPSGYKPEYAHIAERMCLLGAKNEEIAAALNISRMTLDRWMDTQDGFRDAIKRGREGADAAIAFSFYHRAKGYSHESVKIFLNKQGEPVVVPYIERFPPDTVAGIFWLKNRRPDLWRDKQDIDMSVHGQIGRLPDDDRTGKALAALQAMLQGKRPKPTADSSPPLIEGKAVEAK